VYDSLEQLQAAWYIGMTHQNSFRQLEFSEEVKELALGAADPQLVGSELTDEVRTGLLDQLSSML
jgi:hypothetical protein